MDMAGKFFKQKDLKFKAKSFLPDIFCAPRCPSNFPPDADSLLIHHSFAGLNVSCSHFLIASRGISRRRLAQTFGSLTCLIIRRIDSVLKPTVLRAALG
jgi:hypothetical protein